MNYSNHLIRLKGIFVEKRKKTAQTTELQNSYARA